jgi:dTDP-4-amino-4,6-dideoxygalactose transaminase
MIPFLDLAAQYRTIKDEIDEALARVVSKSQFILGPEVEAFEEEFARYCGARHAVGVNNGTSALHLALLAGGIRPGDEVITVSFTFVATVEAILYAGARPVFVDVDPRSCTMDPSKLEDAVTPRTRAILPVHLYGRCADMDPIATVARRHGLLLIEDAAQAQGAAYKERRAGSLGDLACFSFYPGKNLGAFGEGGAVVTSDSELARTVRMLRDHGQSSRYNHDTVGYNARLEGIQGAVLRVKLRYLDGWNEARRVRAGRYRARLGGVPVAFLDDVPYATPVHHIFPVFTKERTALQEHLRTKDVGTGIHYPAPVHLQKA